MGLKFSAQSPSYGICAENSSPHGCLMPSPGPDDLQDRLPALRRSKPGPPGIRALFVRSWGGQAATFTESSSDSPYMGNHDLFVPMGRLVLFTPAPGDGP